MSPYVRIYASETGAMEVDAALAAAGIKSRSVLLPSRHAGQEEAAVNAAIEDGNLSARFILICNRSLKEGRSIVAAQAPYGRGRKALSIMDSSDTVYTDRLEGYIFDSPSPLSDMLSLPALSTFVPTANLMSSDWSMFGSGLLRRSPSPLSSMFGMPTLTKSKRDRRTSFGFPLLSRNPAPFSAMFGMRTLSKTKAGWEYSFGFPLLSQNPTPLSSMLGMKALSRDSQKRK